ncbi:hypothetical protein [Hymenobacter cellulosivorans]|uniref:DUF4136 domain-containing protein n=1 Tax=Hymenobacter cellulosivorans TaxID=2932249 RepID=A0ABY4F613_9BACT|nr:hypothetical protein [Hymenobacter cellulosivorans]UOQ51468.1 hypothetical protein MUN80_17065 [Hymenobacter cellulosivorans]
MKRLRYSLVSSLLALAATVGGSVGAHAQQRASFTQQFAGSTVLLTTGDTLRGPLALHRNEDVILLTMPDNTVNTLSAVAVQSFAVKAAKRDNNLVYQDFYDTRSGFYRGSPYYDMPPRRLLEKTDTSLVRVFRTYRWNHDKDYSDFKSPAFFEQLSSGPNILLRREALVERVMNNGPMYGGYGYGYGNPYGVPRTSYYREIKDAFYLGLPNGNVLPLRSPKKDLLAAFRQQAKQIEQYAKDNKLDFTDARELAFIVNYANSLQPKQ